MSRTARWMLLVTGVLLIASGLAHAFLGWPAIRRELVTSQVPADLGEAIGSGWLYGSGAMLTFGVMVLMVGWPGSAGHVGVAKVAGPIGIFYLIFGVSAWLYSSLNPHFIGFMVLGLLLAGVVYALRRGVQRGG